VSVLNVCIREGNREDYVSNTFGFGTDAFAQSLVEDFFSKVSDCRWLDFVWTRQDAPEAIVLDLKVKDETVTEPVGGALDRISGVGNARKPQLDFAHQPARLTWPRISPLLFFFVVTSTYSCPPRRRSESGDESVTTPRGEVLQFLQNVATTLPFDPGAP
jgi:hypothetical protein